MFLNVRLIQEFGNRVGGSVSSMQINKSLTTSL